ncbi:hypothetical protein T4D_1107 [Trichinella pseudospiralis]|uniref:Uncharacterized protein n=1 Tax=Trichinella pseudospiralis TaxID=6337 RepID=A0A0V1FNK7_TRIPS|nr:hypothetical protein T4D_1107 [Trichinella pseudospiralis]
MFLLTKSTRRRFSLIGYINFLLLLLISLPRGVCGRPPAAPFIASVYDSDFRRMQKRGFISTLGLRFEYLSLYHYFSFNLSFHSIG